MSPDEIAHRIVEQARRYQSSKKTYGWAAFSSSQLEPAIVPGLCEGLFGNASSTFREAASIASHKILAGEFRALGLDWPKRDPADLFPASLWTLDPVSGQNWPGAEAFCYDIRYRHERRLGDIKYVWEINRLQFLQPLAAAYALSGDRRALAAIESAIMSWSESNPPFQGVGWNSGIEISLRAVSILVTMSFCGGDLKPAVTERANSLLSASLYWLTRYPSSHSSANNHLVAEAMGQFLIASAMPALRGAGPSAARAQIVLEREALRQILPDGVAAEQSPTYGAFTVEMLLLCGLAARACKPFSRAVEDRLGAFADWIAWISYDDNATPAIGDDDEGRILNLVYNESSYSASVASTVSTFINKPVALRSDPPCALRTAVFGPPVLDRCPLVGIKSFEDGGYTVARVDVNGRKLVAILDHGQLGYLSIAAHGHADALSLLLAINGRPIFVDPGTYLYHSGDLWRDWFRGTRSHNTLSLDGANSSVISGSFNWSSKAKSQLIELASDEVTLVSLSACHDGYRYRFGIDHHRKVEINEKYITIVDLLVREPGRSGTKLMTELTFQLAENLTARVEDGRIIVTDSEVDVLSIKLDVAGETSIRVGEEDFDGGWISPGFGLIVPAPRIQWRAEGFIDRVTTEIQIL